MARKTEFLEEAELDTATSGLFGRKEAVATIAVKDLKVAREFYVGKLGLEPVPGGRRVLTLRRRSNVFVYESKFAGTNKATAATWLVGDGLEPIVKDLKARGSRSSITTCRIPDRGTYVSGLTKVAWFRTPTEHSESRQRLARRSGRRAGMIPSCNSTSGPPSWLRCQASSGRIRY